MKRDDTRTLLEGLSGGMSAEELQFAALKGIISGEISMKRQELHLTQTQFAEMMGVTQSSVSKWEAGEANFTLETLCRIAAKLDIEMQSPYVTRPPCTSYRPVGQVLRKTAGTGWRSAFNQAGSYDAVRPREM